MAEPTITENAVKPKILIACWPCSAFNRKADVIGCAMAEDGDVLAEHLSSDTEYARHDMGLTSDWQHEKYTAKFPDGYELIWLGLTYKGDPRWTAALALNKVRAATADAHLGAAERHDAANTVHGGER